MRSTSETNMPTIYTNDVNVRITTFNSLPKIDDLLDLDAIFMRGAPGSGKSTMAKEISDEFGDREGLSIDDYAVVLETDDYWIRPDGFYDFQAKHLGRAHDWCFETFVHHIAIGRRVILCNTNIELLHMARYIEAIINDRGKADVTFIQLNSDYGNVHGVPNEVVDRMRNRLAIESTPERIQEFANTFKNCVSI